MSQDANGRPGKIHSAGRGMAIGVALGAAMGVALGNMAFMGAGIAIGAALGVAISAGMENREK